MDAHNVKVSLPYTFVSTLSLLVLSNLWECAYIEENYPEQPSYKFTVCFWISLAVVFVESLKNDKLDGNKDSSAFF